MNTPRHRGTKIDTDRQRWTQVDTGGYRWTEVGREGQDYTHLTDLYSFSPKLYRYQTYTPAGPDIWPC